MPDAIADHLGERRLVRIDEGQSGAHVYRAVGGAADLFLKVGHGVAASLVADEAVRLAWLGDRAPSAAIVAVVHQRDSVSLLTTALRGVPASGYIKADRSRAVAVAQEMAGFLRHLHDLPIAECPFDSSVAAWLPVARGLVADGLVDTEDFDAEHRDWSAERVLAKVEELAEHARGQVVVHGDFSLGNIIVAEDGTIAGCIDVGRLGVGDPYRDIVIGWRDLGGFGAAAQAAFLAALDMEGFEEPRRALHQALDELF